MTKQGKKKPMWYRPDKEIGILTPSVLVYPERIEENIRRLIAVAGSADRLRPHVKTHKLAEVVKLQVNYGIGKFKCATLTEMEMVAANGGRDVLLAYPLFGPGIALFMDLNKRYPEVKFSVIVDSIGAIEELGDQAGREGCPLNVFVDLDNGMHRTGMEPARAGALIEYLTNQPMLSFEGLHVYDGHIHQSDFEERKKQCDRDFEPVNGLLKDLEGKGIEVEELACGGTPTFPIHALDPSRTLCPGTPLLWDAGYAAGFPDLDFLHAAVVARDAPAQA
jgi:D-serine deaminase-like pyridoxal phosphate-dependent protein